MAKCSRSPGVTIDLGCGVRKIKDALCVDTVAVPGEAEALRGTRD